MILGKNLSRQLLLLLASNLSVVSKKTAEALSCSKTFAGPQTLKIHERVHNGLNKPLDETENFDYQPGLPTLITNLDYQP